MCLNGVARHNVFFKLEGSTMCKIMISWSRSLVETMSLLSFDFAFKAKIEIQFLGHWMIHHTKSCNTQISDEISSIAVPSPTSYIT